jgi:hypothetical protein
MVRKRLGVLLIAIFVLAAIRAANAHAVLDGIGSPESYTSVTKIVNVA